MYAKLAHSFIDMKSIVFKVLNKLSLILIPVIYIQNLILILGLTQQSLQQWNEVWNGEDGVR
jgi:hypothetical protein